MDYERWPYFWVDGDGIFFAAVRTWAEADAEAKTCRGLVMQIDLKNDKMVVLRDYGANRAETKMFEDDTRAYFDFFSADL